MARSAPSTPRRKQEVKAGAISRVDSDDELGLEDHPWEWIYDGDTEPLTQDDEVAELLNGPITPQNRGRSKKVKTPSNPSSGKKSGDIIGARMGNFKCYVGDAVLLKAEGTNEAWVGIICELRDDEDDEGSEDGRPPQKIANFMWFSSPTEIRNKEKKRQDFLPNELYITPSWDFNDLEAINGRARIIGYEDYQKRFGTPDHPLPKSKREKWDGKTFLCRRGCNTRTATYTDEFNWPEIYTGTDADIMDLIELVKTETKATRKRSAPPSSTQADYIPGASQPTGAALSDDDAAPRTPRKRRKSENPRTPTSGKEKGKSHPATPSSTARRRILIKKPLEYTPLGTRRLSPSSAGPGGYSTPTAFQHARNLLHVSAVPTALPCREQEFETVYTHLEAAITAGNGLCIYISGIPGTGKTATVREVVAQLHASVQEEELDDFIFVEINGMKISEPHQSYSLLWEALKGDRVSPAHALDLLEREFGNPSPRRVPVVVLMDELDQLVTRNQSVMYNFFNWPQLRHSRLIVLAVANTMDLPERTLSNKISSRLGLTRITFPGYTFEQLMKIIEARLKGVKGPDGRPIVEPDAVQFASRKVAAVSGDARRALDICRRAVEIAEGAAAAAETEGGIHGTPSKTPARKVTGGNKGIVTIGTIKAAINEATSNPLQKYLKSTPLTSKVFLAGLLARMRRSGIADTTLGAVMDEAKRLVKMSENVDMKRHLLLPAILPITTPTAHRGDLMFEPQAPFNKRLKKRGPNGEVRLAFFANEVKGAAAEAAASSVLDESKMLPRVNGMGFAAQQLAAVGILTLENRRGGERTARCRLAVGEDEIRAALKDDLEVRGMGFSM